MEVTELALRVILLFFPGVVAAILVDALTNHRQLTPFVFGTHAFVLGILSYLTLSCFRSIWNWTFEDICKVAQFPELIFFRALADKSVGLGWIEIVLAVAAATLVALVLSAAINHKWLHRIARNTQVSRRSGELDTWSLLFNSSEIGWINVRDIQRDLVYEGWVDAFSDTSDAPELLMRDVAVYRNLSGKRLYRTPRVYLKLNPNDVIIEYPPPTSGE